MNVVFGVKSIIKKGIWGVYSVFISDKQIFTHDIIEKNGAYEFLGLVPFP